MGSIDFIGPPGFGNLPTGLLEMVIAWLESISIKHLTSVGVHVQLYGTLAELAKSPFKYKARKEKKGT